MRHLDRLGLAQRIVLVIGVAFALLALGAFSVSIRNPTGNFGWFGYAPPARRILVEDTALAPWQELLIWLGLVAVWTTASIAILKRPREP